MEPVLGVKIGCLFALLVLTLVCGLIPICFKWFQIEAARGRHRQVLSLLGCISAGIFLGAGFMHMTAEALEGIESEIRKVTMQNRTESGGNSSGDANSASSSLPSSFTLPPVSPPTVLSHLQLIMASEAEKTFKRFAVFGESSSSGVEINNKNFSKLCKDCGIMDGKMVTSTDVDIVFSKVKDKTARTITFAQFQEAMKELGQKRFKGKNPDETLENIYKLMEGKDPATPGVTKATTVGGVSRLTDTSKYTGSHKERFDESGKGKGIAGREERSENSGYVSAYKGAGTYDKKKESK